MKFREGLLYTYQNRRTDGEITDPFYLYCRLSDLCSSEYADKEKVELFYAIDRRLCIFETLIKEGKKEVSEDDITNALYTAHCPDPDLIVRTGGDLRLSNFLLWQAAYAEFYFTDTLWPDLDEREIDTIIDNFYNRKRRYGGV